MDPKLVKIVSDFNATLSNITYANNMMLPLSPRPYRRKVFLTPAVKKFLGLHLWEDSVINLTNIMETSINEHRETLDPDNLRDMTDVYLNEISTTTDPSSSFYKDRGYYAMINNFIDLFVAGMETTASTIIWTFLYLLHHPDAKEKVHAELDQVR